MKPKAITTALLLAFVVLTAAWAVRDALRAPAEREAAEAAAGPEATRHHQLLVYYFYTNTRCASCLKIEELTARTMDRWYDAPRQEALLSWRPVNIEQPGNEHYIDEYEITVKSVVVAEWHDGRVVRWKNLSRVWDLLDDDEAFVTYVRDEVGAWLGGIA